MSASVPASARRAPAAARNRDPILDVLRPRLPPSGQVLEIAAGTGEHALHMAAALPGLQWRPTDADPEALASIAAWRDEASLPNLLPPLLLDAREPEGWPVSQADAIVSINMIHIAPWAAAEGLMAGAGRLLPTGGPLALYGPYIESGLETAPTNLAFDEDLRRRHPAWGLRALDAVTALAARQGLELDERIAMPANNLILIFRKSGSLLLRR
jgi:cyclopropane fatty-acyl-phospholipid synthase-like methyltransferase